MKCKYQEEQVYIWNLYKGISFKKMNHEKGV